MKYNLTIGFYICFVFLTLTSCARYVEKSKDYQDLVAENDRISKRNKSIINERAYGTSEIKRLIAKNDSLELQIETIKKEGKPRKTNIAASSNISTLKKYQGVESMHNKDIKNNQSLKVNLKNKDFSAYIVDDAKDIQFFWKDDKKKLIKNLKKLQDIAARENKQLLFGMNAGIFNPNRTPTGLFIKEGKELVKLNVKNAPGNFFLKPNGVFFIEQNGIPHVMETNAFKEQKEHFLVENATQSGPMLVIDGKIHPKFVEGSNNLNIRNGVGINKEGKAVFIITGKPVSLYTFASIFKEHFNCDNALYLDGAISDAFIPGIKKYGLTGNFGPLIAILNQKIATQK